MTQTFLHEYFSKPKQTCWHHFQWRSTRNRHILSLLYIYILYLSIAVRWRITKEFSFIHCHIFMNQLPTGHL